MTDRTGAGMQGYLPPPRRPRRAGDPYAAGDGRVYGGTQPPSEYGGAREPYRDPGGNPDDWEPQRRNARERRGRERGATARQRDPHRSASRGSGSPAKPARSARPPKPPRPPKRPRRRTPVWASLTVAIGAVLMLLSGTAVVGYEVLNDRYAGNVQQDNLLGGAAADPGKELEGPLSLLLLGVEERGQGARADTIIVLHIPASHDEAYLISVPRDTWVTVPGYWDMKITEAFNEGYESAGNSEEDGWGSGAQLVASTLNAETGLQFDAAAIVNFGGFEKIIDELGGLDFCFDTGATSEHLVLYEGEPISVGKARKEGIWDTEPVRYEEGCGKVEGWQALDYVRQRKTLESDDGDYGRQRHQQQLLKAMADAAISRDTVTNIGRLDSLVLAAGDALIVDTNGVPLPDFVFTLKDVGINDLVSLRTNGGKFNSADIDGVSAELLSEESLTMFQAAANDTMGEFVLEHPEFVNPT